MEDRSEQPHSSLQARFQRDKDFKEAMAQQPKPTKDQGSLADNLGEPGPYEPNAVRGVNRAIGEKVFKELTKK